MCGIAGFWKTPGSPANREWLKWMGDRLSHRGPDGSGYFMDESVGLAHRRLSIIDLAGGAQPLGNEDRSINVVFNGEIYNFLELRRGLVARGHSFTTSSDTEVLVHLYEETGHRLPEHLDGMFAFAIWDSRCQELFLCRDRLGKKPLYYSTEMKGLRLCFGSELKALTALPVWNSDVDAQSVADYLALSYVPDPQTIFRGVLKLPPAHSLTLRRDGLTLRRYWRPSFDRPTRSFEHTAEEIQTLARDAVERRMISDVPLGAFLSGGVDSSAVVGFMAGATPRSVKTFSIGFTERSFDERRFARLAAQKHGTDHREQIITPKVHETLPLLAHHFDEPFGDASAIPMLYLSRMTREHVTVALSGDGADELFGGYRRYRYGLIEARLREHFPQWFRRSIVQSAAHYYPKFDYLPQIVRAKALLTNIASETADAYFTSMSTFRDEGLEAVLSPEFRRALGGYSPRQRFRQRFWEVRHLDPLQQMQAVDLDTYLPGDILVKADRTTMAFSLEARAPWLDYRIADVALGLPPGWKIRGAAGKYIFKKATRSIVPAPVVARRKMGFSVPMAGWMRTSLRETFESTVLQPEMECYLELGEVRRLWREHQSSVHNHERKLWNLLVLAMWHVCHVSRRAADIPLGAYSTLW